MTQCKLCDKEKELRISHIVPKFVYQWMKDTGPGRFRQMKNVNNPIQDGIKTLMLCDECEIKFGKREKWFRKHIFYEFLTKNEKEFSNCPELKYFAISILWRVLTLFINDGNKYTFQEELKAAENEWRNFLDKDLPLNKYKKIHLVFIPEELIIEEDIRNIHTYLQRAVDIEIAESDTKSFIYAKFSRFVLIGEIIGIDETEMIGTNIIDIENIIPNNQIVKDRNIIDFMINRASGIKSFEDLSLKQQKQIDSFYKNKLTDILKSDYWRVKKKDL